MLVEMTRSEVRRLEYSNPLPTEYQGELKLYEEVFINPGGEPTAEEAEKHLHHIQTAHPTSGHWFAGKEGVFKDADNLYYAFRHHAKYA